MTKQLDRAALDAWVDGLIRERLVIGVRADGDRFSFGPLSSAAELRLDYDVTKIPPKKLLQPQSEPLLKFETGGSHVEVVEGEPFVLFGVHPYDMAAILQMDAVFSQGNCDKHYFGRRDRATIVVSDVQRASSNVFAGCMGTATIRKGFDVLVTKVGKRYVVEAGSDKGVSLCKAIENAQDADPASLARREQVWEDNAVFLRKHELKMAPSDIPALLSASEEHPVWEENAAKCFSCGSCNMVCPTCYCFDVRDEVDWSMKNGVRTRTWDGCMLADFATVAGGHNFRKSRADRYRHRYYRKGLYVPGKLNGEIACVGCGRCIGACVAKIANPVEVWNRVMEVK